jgi:hypothetical protein
VPISLERLKQSLATADSERRSLEALKHEPPKIIVTDELSELVLYDGEPRTLPIEKTDFEYVANCAFAIIKDKKSGTYYLSGGKIWYSAQDPKGPWTSIAKPPAEVLKIVPPDTTSTPAPAKPPKLVVAPSPPSLSAATDRPSGGRLGKTASFSTSPTPNRR